MGVVSGLFVLLRELTKLKILLPLTDRGNVEVIKKRTSEVIGF
jgi:hypothetical protein